MKPIILITTSLNSDERFNKINRDYCKSVSCSGGIPLIMDQLLIYDIDRLLDLADGILITGGGDIHSKYFNEPLHEKVGTIIEERDEFEISLFRKAFERNMPVLAICRGEQIINVAMGGGLIQHMENFETHQMIDSKRKELTHNINIETNSLLFDIIGQEELGVNSMHHQCVDKIALCFSVSAYSEDGMIEAIECTDKAFILGVQWHPEALYTDHEPHRKLFDRFIIECKRK